MPLDRSHRPVIGLAQKLTGLLLTVLLLTALLAACGKQTPPPPLPPLPGVAAGNDEWFWRDVLAAPLPNEAAADPSWQQAATPAARIDALEALVDGHHPAAVTTLMAALRDERDGIAAAAAHLLGELNARAAIPRLLKGLGPFPVDYDVPLVVRTAEASALARMGHPAGMPFLIMVLAEKTDLERDVLDLAWARTQQMAFAQEIALEGVEALAGTTYGYHPTAPIPVRTEALRQLEDWWQTHRLTLWGATAPLQDDALILRTRLLVGHLGAYQLRQVDGARHTLAHLGPGVLPFLEEGLASDDDYMRLHCLEVMERLADRCDDKARGRLAIVASEPLLTDPVPDVAAQAARVCAAAQVVDPLVIALRNRGQLPLPVLVAVVDAMGRCQRPAALAELTALAQELDTADLAPDLRAALEAALWQRDASRPASSLTGMLASTDRTLVFAALERIVAMTGSDHGLAPSAPPEQRAQALARVETALVALRR